jgi:hypothetical protein
MRYKPKSIAALQVALGGLPDAMHVEADRGIGVSAKTVGELRKVAAWPDNLVITTPQARYPESAIKVQDECCDAGLTKTLSRSSSGYRLRYFGVRRSIVL